VFGAGWQRHLLSLPFTSLLPSAIEMDSHAPPSAATDAVLVKSVEMPEDAQKVEELDFNKFKGRPITVDDLFQGMKHMGFQASSMCEAVRIINEMVRTRRACLQYGAEHRGTVQFTLTEFSERGKTPSQGKRRPSSWATPPT
jgi:hypothetical protein